MLEDYFLVSTVHWLFEIRQRIFQFKAVSFGMPKRPAVTSNSYFSGKQQFVISNNYVLFMSIMSDVPQKQRLRPLLLSTVKQSTKKKLRNLKFQLSGGFKFSNLASTKDMLCESPLSYVYGMGGKSGLKKYNCFTTLYQSR